MSPGSTRSWRAKAGASSRQSRKQPRLRAFSACRASSSRTAICTGAASICRVSARSWQLEGGRAPSYGHPRTRFLRSVREARQGGRGRPGGGGGARYVERNGGEGVLAADARHIDDALPAEALLGFGKGGVG